MTAATTGIVVVGLALALALGLAGGFDTRSVVLLALTAAVGAVAIAAARRSTHGRVEPARCDECEGVMSPHAPYCKHCGARSKSGVA